MALELIIDDRTESDIIATCLACGLSIRDHNYQVVICPKCQGNSFQWNDIGHYYGDIDTLDFSPSTWSHDEKFNVVYLSDDEVDKLIIQLGVSSEEELYDLLDIPQKDSKDIKVARRAFSINCPFINVDGNFINILATNIIKK